MKKYLIKSESTITLVEEDWKQSIIADTYTYLLVAALAALLYLYTASFGRSIIFEVSFVVIFAVKIHSMFKAKSRHVDPEEARKIANDFFNGRSEI